MHTPSPIRSTPALLLALFIVAGCGKHDADHAAAPTRAPAVAVPASLFAETPPPSVVSLTAAKDGASAGDHVVFDARVGGRRDPFVENRAIFVVADTSLPSCAELHEDDSCRTPWDYCCEPKDSLLRNMATVQVVDDDGQPLKASLAGVHGLIGLATVVVSGTVEQVDDAGTFVVRAESIHVKGG